jgi:hypothetical protein
MLEESKTPQCRIQTLSDIIIPWVKKLDTHTPDVMRGESHWYTRIRLVKRLVPFAQTTEVLEDWVMTVRSNHVEVRNEKGYSVTVIGWEEIDAADPEFFTKVESALRAALAYLAGS